VGGGGFVVTLPADMTCKETVYITPESVLDPVREYFGGTIDLDPATTPENPVGADFFLQDPGLDEAEHIGCLEYGSGLESCWAERDTVWINPPYGKELSKWTAKIREEADDGAHIVAILPGQRFETQYVQRDVFNPRLQAICFLKRRVKFLDRDGKEHPNNPNGS